jgi:hypothetical protein
MWGPDNRGSMSCPLGALSPLHAQPQGNLDRNKANGERPPGIGQLLVMLLKMQVNVCTNTKNGKKLCKSNVHSLPFLQNRIRNKET